jgi:heterodisulfide reductase subunit C
MAKVDFGYVSTPARGIDLNFQESELVLKLMEREPTLKRCISCGKCAAMCTAGHYTQMQFYRIRLMLGRGLHDGLQKMAGNCMLCGKCQLFCPKGVNIRHGILLISQM